MLIQQVPGTRAVVTAAENFFTFIIQTVDGYIETFMNAGIDATQAEIKLTVAAIFGIYLAIYGWMVIYGYVEGNVSTILKKLGKFVLVYMLATTGPAYSLLVRDILWTLPEGIAGVLLETVSGADSTITSQIDSIGDVMKVYNDNLNVITDKIARSGRVVPDVIAAFLSLLMQIPVIAALFVVLIAKVGLSIMIILGPFLIITSLFGLTKGIFEGWLRQSITFVMMAILAYAVIALLMSILNSFGTDLAAGRNALKYTKALPLALIAVVAGVVFTQIPSFATGIVGGIGLSDLGLIRNTANSARDLDRTKPQAQANGQAGRSQSRTALAGARVGRAIGRTGGDIGKQVGQFSKSVVGPQLAKRSPKLHSAITNTASALSASGSAVKSKAIGAAKTANYYTGAKNVQKPQSRTEK